jgi:hypothetical protein
MRSRLGQHVRSQLVGYVALFIALGGVSYAAVSLPRNSVGTKQIQRNAVNSSKVKNGSLLKADFGTGQLPRGMAGPKGPTGPQGSPDTAQQVLDKVVTLDGSGSGLDADTLDGKDSNLLGSGRIHTVGNSGIDVVTPIFPDLGYHLYCSHNEVRILFLGAVETGTANAMIVANGIETPSGYPYYSFVFNVTDGAQNQGFAYSGNSFSEAVADDTGTAGAESQIIIDNPTRTYSIALHMFHAVDNDPNTSGDQYFCEAYGTATVGS